MENGLVRSNKEHHQPAEASISISAGDSQAADTPSPGVAESSDSCAASCLVALVQFLDQCLTCPFQCLKWFKTIPVHRLPPPRKR